MIYPHKCYDANILSGSTYSATSIGTVEASLSMSIITSIGKRNTGRP